jgi:L-histidine N-alpha-methyltransferase
MHLVPREAQVVTIPGVGVVRFGPGESLRTEISCKHDRASVAQLFEAAGLELEEWRSDPEALFALVVGVRG